MSAAAGTTEPAVGDRRGLPQWVAALVVFTTSAAVLVLEILAARLLAPYVGDSLRTYTAIIGVVLAGIAAGSWWGGRWADTHDPRRLLGPVVTGGGLLGLAVVPLVAWAGEALRGTGAAGTVLVTALAFLAPALLLTAATPLVVKLRLADLDETGRVVGHLSAVGTAGALTGTFATGFVLVAALPTRVVVVLTGSAMVVLGLALALALRDRSGATAVARDRGGAAVVAVVAVAASGLAGAGLAVGSPCERETPYYCVSVTSETTADGREVQVLVLDSLRHSAVDPDDPEHLHFRYTRLVGAVLASRPEGPLDVVHVGAGGFTLPRWLEATRPGSRSTVLEIDPALEDVARERLGWDAPASTRVVTGDARLTLEALPDDSADVVVGDAFGDLAVPWHLATAEFATGVRDVLRPDGVYVLNVIDHGEQRLARAEAATLAGVFDHVGVLAGEARLAREEGGNTVLVASQSPLDTTAVEAALSRLDEAGPGSERTGGGGERLVTGEPFWRWVGAAPVLRDDHAPVDQLLTPYDPPAPAS
ncbi:fused MFS/spermidine synthase [Aquipuribacter sp. SD81]|uniref:fused MFS/spermidine synthase n=1 Tax=Aquipuribacter sp. SD81 TaxID=3127703 RepID=UPI00301ADA08